ncbi:hypothetical protein [Agarivorans gilvus]|uniref:Uncharacterized protein n=1 Tax=Agarivorans gilvus TaxID=680279 RepID=A0ABQ1I3V3_9ALTE|nr:hypothetical protein [Agarivorans gilvus]GGB13977.1 hypothetical protein GCM10007414_29210 [Agarivorans gilvus]
MLALSSDVRSQSIEQISVSVKAAKDLLTLKFYIPGYVSRPIPEREELIDVDIDPNGTFEEFNLDSPELSLKWRYLDNADFTKRINIDDSTAVEEQGINFTYLNYDRNASGNVSDDACYLRYT